jgi:uncharacterized cupredoxin-like copper-binding protein
MPARRVASIVRPFSLAVSIVLLAACSSSTPASNVPANSPPAASVAPPASAASAATSEEPSVAASPSAAAGAPSTLALTAQDFSFTGASSVAAGVTTISLVNTGKEEHQAQLVKINDGKTFDDLTTVLKNPDPSAALALVSFAGGPNGVQPGATGEATSDLQPGHYAFLCFISGADGVPHFAKGMIAPLEVTGTSTGGSLPTTDATVTAKDFGYETPASVPAGTHSFTLTNSGPQSHEAGIIKLNAGVTVDQVLAAMTGGTEPAGPPPWSDVGGIGAVAPGSSATFTATLDAGATYAFICFVPDPATGKPHAQLGMIAPIPVK